MQSQMTTQNPSVSQGLIVDIIIVLIRQDLDIILHEPKSFCFLLITAAGIATVHVESVPGRRQAVIHSSSGRSAR